MAKNKNIMSASDASRLKIEGEMNIYRAHELKKLLLDSLSHAGELEVDLSAVTELDTCGLQILMLAKKTAKEKNVGFRLVEKSSVIQEVFDLLEVGAFFGEQPNIPSTSTST
jgi:anti-sigma B factor antagonist